MKPLWLSLLFVLIASVAAAQFQGVTLTGAATWGFPTVDYIHGYTASAGVGDGWDAAEILVLMAARPNHLLSMRSADGNSPGRAIQQEIGTVVDAVQAGAAAAGVDASMLMTSFRSDVFNKMTAGRPECVDDSCAWEGTMGDVDNDTVADTFDTDWVRLISDADHDWAATNLGVTDPIPTPAGDGEWRAWVDKAAIRALGGGGFQPGLYMVETDLEVLAVQMDMSDTDYRAWSALRMVYILGVMGFDPGESFKVLIATKPGWWDYYDGPDSGDAQGCWVSGANMYHGPSHNCTGTDPGGPYTKNPYTSGQYETIMNTHLTELHDALVTAGYPSGTVQFVFNSAPPPPPNGEIWSDFDWTRRKEVGGWMYGELGAQCDCTDPTSCSGGGC